jgi:lysophospholipase L1-like esterase
VPRVLAGERRLRTLLAISLALNVACAGWFVTGRLRRPDGLAEYRRARVELFASLDTRSPDLLLLGDSLVDRGEWTELLGPGVVNRGVASDRVRDAIARVAEIGRRDPRRIAILLGINDLLHGFPVGDVARDYAELLAALAREAPRARLYVLGVLPVRPIDDARRVSPDTVRALNARLSSLAAERGAVFVDLAPRFSTATGELAPDLTTDGVHLTARGYHLWSEVLRDRVLGDGRP